MDFNDTADDARFRADVSAWLAENAPRERDTTVPDLQWSKTWEKKKADGGWSCIHWPKEYGGRDASAVQMVIFSQEESKYPVIQNYPCFNFGQGMVGPVIMAYGSEAVKHRYLPKIASGEEVWCQLFSEPSVGSDLAALRTKAVRDGDDWVINGQKVWTSFAHYSDFGLLIARTDPTVPKHAGLTCFFFDMKSPGVEIKPIRQITGDAEFNEEFLTDVRIPDSQRLGKAGQGWEVTVATLMNERATLRGRKRGEDVERLVALAKQLSIEGEPAITNAAVRDRIADWWCTSSGLYYNGLRSLTAQSKGKMPGPEESIYKMVKQPMVQEIYAFCLDLMEGHGAITQEDFAVAGGRYQTEFLESPGMRIAGGTDEIMANIIADRVLHLPTEQRVDKNVPFNKIPRR